MVMHTDQLDLTAETARRLVDDQFPQWRHLPLHQVDSDGTVNAIFRIGDEFAARFPLRAEEPTEVRAWLVAEAEAAAELAACSPVPAPLPVALGEPGYGYPLSWAVQTWLPGRVASVEDPGGSLAFARDLATFVRTLRAVDTRGRRFSGGGRGGELPDHDDWVALCFDRSAGMVDVPRLRRLWAQLRTLPPAGPDVMSHKDLIPGNVLVGDGRLTGVLDGGGFGPADPGLDLVGAWHLLDRPARDEFARALGCGDVEWGRGMAWALQQAIGLVWYYAETNVPMSRLGRRTVARLLAAT
ncbi:aminoglycoside phosphotransferase family protein [Micromonospora mirobrigensis]|uniref:Predicted kinase, aminoglycoside phosphotransferase (APT) family n=1 Tax=Micromonospora mirobrigensis TaxID=262898 RepID=A0A1C4UXD6_9ACTN|nr:aminoglycoside phosphotransferase family protein [Micromonospora mirobrigensis]SCE76301.1 Predicted kinase, aminoglycoside phosphotransferase (APT) family [Micromonospora mirobrigensis]